MATKNDTARRPYERPTLVKTVQLEKIVAVSSPPTHSVG